MRRPRRWKPIYNIPSVVSKTTLGILVYIGVVSSLCKRHLVIEVYRIIHGLWVGYNMVYIGLCECNEHIHCKHAIIYLFHDRLWPTDVHGQWLQWGGQQVVLHCQRGVLLCIAHASVVSSFVVELARVRDVGVLVRIPVISFFWYNGDNNADIVEDSGTYEWYIHHVPESFRITYADWCRWAIIRNHLHCEAYG